MAIICIKKYFNWLLFVKNNWKIIQMAIICEKYSTGYYLWKIIQMAIICEK